MKSSLTLRTLALAGLVICHPRSASADVRLPAIFSDHAVLLSEAAVPVWGWADAGEKVEVSFAGQTKSATPGADGKWTVKLDALKADAKPQALTVKGKNTLTVKDVLVGEVWLGSGQSNMAMTVNRAKDFEQEQAAANLPQIRMFTVALGGVGEGGGGLQGRVAGVRAGQRSACFPRRYISSAASFTRRSASRSG